MVDLDDPALFEPAIGFLTGFLFGRHPSGPGRGKTGSVGPW
jgi:hypothetical protein